MPENLNEPSSVKESSERIKPNYTLASPEFFHLLSRMEQSESKLERRIELLEQKIDQKIEFLDQKIEFLEQKIDKKIELLEQKIDKKIEILSQKVDGLSKWIMATLVTVILTAFADRIL
jgi:predicted PurR-regulated permease PerM